ncbi:MFS transporter [Bacillus glycinifermentans]|uniref:MFS transporter n=1 Tax=Bacillus glycinifermentans TaxID=1664069 RepID=UPI002DBBBE92|nr:MFS transporter [Bacillus glycinifermentans]MEC3605821.1 MFS transporter [Bacillus glycinifermentans]
MEKDNRTKASGISRGLVFLMAVASGITVANIYLNQTLLVSMGQTFHATAAQAGMIATITQAGYALGNFMLVPLGDIFERRRLIVALLVLVCLCSVASAFAQNFLWLAAAQLSLGVFTIIPQIIVPFAADLADENERGKVLGNVAIGLVCGILGARLISGIIDSHAGWRTVYWITCGSTLIIMLLIRLFMPKSKASHTINYGKLLASLGPLLLRENMLRKACLSQGLMFGAFSLFWTTLVFLLNDPPYSYGSQAAGMIGLVGIGGAFAAPVIGRVIDKRGAIFANVLCMSISLLAFMLLFSGKQSLIAIIIGALFVTMGTQANQVVCQVMIFQLAADMRSRLNGMLMVMIFLGGALGSYAGVLAWTGFHWTGVCLLGMFMIGIAFTSLLIPDRSIQEIGEE